MAKGKHRPKTKKVKRPSWRDDKTAANLPNLELFRPESNTRLEVTIVPEFPPSHPESKVPRPRQGTPGTYKVTFVLSVPGKATYRNELPMQQLMKSGESLLTVSVGDRLRLTIWNQTESVDVIFHSNSQGQISSTELRLSGKSFVDVE